MAYAAPDILLMLSNVQEENAWCFDILDRPSLAPLGSCAIRCPAVHEKDPRRRSLAIDAPEALKPAIRRAALRWHDQQLQQRAVITLDDGSVVDTGVPSPVAMELLQAALLQLPSMSMASNPIGRYHSLCEKTPGDFAYVLNLRPKRDGLLVEAGFAFPMNAPADWAFFRQMGCTGTDIRLRIIRLVNTQEALEAVLAEAEALRNAWFDKPREAVKKEIDARQKAFAARITAQLKPLGFRKKALHWTFTRPDGWQVDWGVQKSQYTDAFYFNLLLTKPDKHPWYMGVIDERPLGNLLDWQAMPAEDFDDLLRAVVQRRILPLMHAPIEQLTHEGGN